jgi:hypothetical protein
MADAAASPRQSVPGIDPQDSLSGLYVEVRSSIHLFMRLCVKGPGRHTEIGVIIDEQYGPSHSNDRRGRRSP